MENAVGTAVDSSQVMVDKVHNHVLLRKELVDRISRLRWPELALPPRRRGLGAGAGETITQTPLASGEQFNLAADTFALGVPALLAGFHGGGSCCCCSSRRW
jgi:hypothetical protein